MTKKKRQVLRDHLFSTDAKYSEKQKFLHTCAYQGVRNVSFSENCASALIELSPNTLRGA